MADVDDTVDLVDRNELHNGGGDSEKKAPSSRKFRFFSIGFNSKADPGHGHAPPGCDNSPVVEADRKRAMWKGKPDELASFDTSASFEDDVFSRGIIDLDTE